MRQIWILAKQAAVLLMASSLCLAQAGCSCGSKDGTQGTAGQDGTVTQGTAGENNTMTQNAGAVSGGTAEAARYEPGTYTGTAQGYAGPIDVTVEVDETHILNVTARGDSETEGIGKTALEKLPAKIVEANSTEIDGISGATFSSRGLFAAVEDALAQATQNR